MEIAGIALHFAPDREIYGDGEDCEQFYKVVSGVVRICKFLKDGRRHIECFHVAGDVFGLELGRMRQMSAEAVSDCTVIAYRRRPVPGSDNGAELPHHLFGQIMRSLAHSQEHGMLLARRGATEKLAYFLLEWSKHSPHDDIVSLAMTRQDIADYLGLTIETVSRTLTQMERDGLIALPSARQIHLLDLEALEDLSA